MRPDPVSALRAGEDARAAMLRLGRAHDQFLTSRAMASCVRPTVARSWRRSAVAGACPDGRCLPALRMGTEVLRDYRSGHPLAPLLPLFRELLGERADDGEYIFAITDAAGTLLWVQGHRGTLRLAERMHFVEGAAWSEAEAGTNAPGTALAVARPVQIFATEHYNSVVHPWSCAASPIRDPDSGLVLGAVDITGGENAARPHALALVQATARAAEAELALRVRAADAARPPAVAPAGGAVRLAALGRDSAQLEVDGRVLRLRPRHSEIVVLLVLAMEMAGEGDGGLSGPDGGLSGPRLAVELSEGEIHPVTLRAEMSRLRALLGEALLGSQPYALRRAVRADFTAVRDLLAEGRVAAALAAYPGPLLPNSEAPAIVAHRASLEQQLRAEVLASADAAALRRWVNAAWGADDAEAWQALARRLPGGSPQRAAAAARAGVLDKEYARSPLAIPVA